MVEPSFPQILLLMLLQFRNSGDDDAGLKTGVAVAAYAYRLRETLAGNVPCLPLTIWRRWEVSAGNSDDGRAGTRLTGLSSWFVVRDCAVVGTISSEGVAFQLAFRTSRQNPGDKLCRDVRNVA